MTKENVSKSGGDFQLLILISVDNASPVQSFTNTSKKVKFTLHQQKIQTMLNKNFTPFPVLKTERLVLRQLSIDDEQEVFILRSDSKINKYLDRQPATTIDDARNFINKINGNASKNDSVYWAISFSDTNELIGTVCLYGFSDEDKKCEIGYELLTKFQGRGIMTEAVEKVIDYAFNTIKVEKIEAFFHRDNQSTIRLLQKFSFKDLKQTDHNYPDVLCYYLKNPDSD